MEKIEVVAPVVLDLDDVGSPVLESGAHVVELAAARVRVDGLLIDFSEHVVPALFSELLPRGVNGRAHDRVDAHDAPDGEAEDEGAEHDVENEPPADHERELADRHRVYFVFQELDLVDDFLALAQHVAALSTPAQRSLLVHFEAREEEKWREHEQGRNEPDEDDEEDERDVREDRRLHPHHRLSDRLAVLALDRDRPGLWTDTRSRRCSLPRCFLPLFASPRY